MGGGTVGLAGFALIEPFGGCVTCGLWNDQRSNICL